ncbi:hypothetical protein [Arcticibacterium luteifluviistationis]|uniref:Outer membrane protein beta-barrel domain-containing protein n=1 Tax=Arcticibacterium luteifluviistationis TaxID=1784714 RepID=A0A2Z4GHR0_9BACT|nr:hypothetical protein [Arcticibacterium luteifluviistationis]AWW00890.1 hypothetical protein DJ013_11735 [Arcticibacterium luteifluviistationis]
MRLILILAITALFVQNSTAQAPNPLNTNEDFHRFYFYGGWNSGTYSKSDITFSGVDYDFLLENVVAKDRQTPFSIDQYINPKNITIPQYNFRIGYFIKKNWDISFGIDHMKYVMQADQTVKITGEIANSNTPYDGSYANEAIKLTEDFLKFEHTDGLNYVNVALRRSQELLDFNKIKVNTVLGAGISVLYPRTNTTLLSRERNDEFHLSGFGLDGTVGLNVTFFDGFFIQSELKGGYINMPDITTTKSDLDKASQDFFFGQGNITFGAIIKIKK